MSPTVLPSAPRRQEGLKGSHVLLTFLMFFGIIFVVNGSLIYNAIATHGGLVANEPYRKGLHYNERIAAGVRQAQLAWNEEVALRRDGKLTIALAGSDGKAVTGLALKAVVGRPASNREDQALALKEMSPGHYEVQASALESGAWLLTFEAYASAAAADPVYRARRRLWLTP